MRGNGDGFLLYYKRLKDGSFELPTFNPRYRQLRGFLSDFCTLILKECR
ncbi:MAG: hypothetical protein ACLUVG_05165 [Phocaeicola vulgatus]